MPPVFDHATPVVDFGATSDPIQLERRDKEWFVWPALAYKVLLPARRHPPFNVFQQVVLEMCRAGVRDAEEMARRLTLAPELVGFVMEQLQGMDALDDRQAPAPRALRLMDAQDEPADVEEAGYVFVDGHTLRVWPRVHRGGLPIVDADFEHGKMKFERGTSGKPQPIRAEVIWPQAGARPRTASTPGTPSAHEAQKAARRHDQRVRAFRRESLLAGKGDKVRAGLKSTGLRVLPLDPEPIFVAAHLFMPKDTQRRAWLVTDPCGLGVSDVLRHGVETLVKQSRHTPARHKLPKLLEKIADQAWHVDEEDLAHHFAEATQAATKRVAAQLGEAAELLPSDVLKRLEDAEKCLEHAHTQDIEHFLGHAYAALESVFGWLVSLYPDPSLFLPLGQSAGDNALLLQKIAEQIGLRTSDRTASLLSVSFGSVKGAITFGNKTLPGSLAAALLAAQRHPDHPLTTLAARAPDALEFLGEIGRLRINASHNTAAVPSRDIAVQVRDRLFTLLRALVGQGPADLKTGQDMPTWGADLMLRLRAQAERLAEHDPGLADRPDLRARVIEMHHAVRLVALLATATNAPKDALNARLRDAVVATTIAVEAAFAEIERNTPTPASVAQAVSDDRTHNAALLAQVAATLGFTLDEAGQLPQSLTHAKANRMRRAAQGRAETLSARVAVQLLAAQQQAQHPLHEVARQVPLLLRDVGHLVETRGHGDDVAVTATEVAEIAAQATHNIRAMLEAID